MFTDSASSLFSLEAILGKITDITLQIQQSSDLDDILRGAIVDARTLLNADRVLICRLLNDQNAVVVAESVDAEWTGISGHPIDALDHDALDHDAIWRDATWRDAIWDERYQQGQITTISDIHNGMLAPCDVALLERLQVQAMLAVPMFSQGSLWGLVMVHHCRSPHEWQSLEVHYVQQVALQLGLAVQQADLRQQITRLTQQPDSGSSEYTNAATEITATEINLRRKAQREQALHGVVQAIRDSLDLDAIFTTSVVQIASFLDAEVSIVQYLPDQGCWRHLVVYEQDTQHIEKLNTDIPDANNPFAAQLKQLQVVQVDNTDTIDDPINQELAQDFPGAWLLVPIDLNGAVWGSLTLGRLNQKTPWHADDLELARRVADQLAIAIHQAQLYQQLQASEEKLSSVLENVNASITRFRMVANHDWDYDYISNGCETLFGYTPQDFRQDKTLWMSRIFPADRERVIHTIFETVFAAGTCHLDYRFHHRDGSIRWISETLSSRWHEAENCWIATLVSLDVSDYKQTKLALETSEQQLSNLISNLPGYVYRVYNDRSYTPEFMSQGVTAITGYHPDEYLVDRSISCGQEIHPDDADQVWDIVQAAVGDRQPYECEYRIITKTGQQKWVWERGRGIYADDGALVWLEGFVTDISDRKQKEDLIQNIAQGVSATTGAEFFRSLVAYLIRLLSVDQAFVGELMAPDNDRLKILAGLNHDQVLDGLELSLTDTPCATVVAQGFFISPDNVRQQFPNSPLLQVWEAESYVGIPLVNASGVVIGLIGIVSNQAIANIQFIQEILTIFAARAASELERQQADRILHRYERITAATPDCVSLIDRNYIYQVVNQTYLEWYSKSYDEIVGHSVSDLLGNYFFTTICKPLFDRCLAGGSPQIVEAWLNYGDGKRRFTRATYTPYLEVDGTISGVVINVHDLTELKLAEEALRESEERFRQMATSIHEVFWMADIDFTRIIYVSPVYEEIWGQSCANLYAQPTSFLDAVHPNDRPQILATISQQRQTGFSHEYRLLRPDGTVCWIWERAFPVLDEVGVPYRLVGVSQDITDRKLAELALATSQQQYQTLVDNSPDIIERFDTQLRHLYVSPALTEITGIAAETFLGKTCQDLGMDPVMIDIWEAAAASLLATGEKQIIEFDTPTLNGMRSFEMVIAPEWSDQDQIEAILCISRDVTDRKAAAIALRQSEARWQFALEGAEDGIWDWDAQTNVVFYSRQWKAMLGYADDEITHSFEQWDALVHPDDKARSYAHIAEHFSGQAPLYQNEHRLRCNDGSYKWILARGKVIEWTADGKPLRMIGVHTDMTDRKAAEIALHQQTERERLLTMISQHIRQTLDLDQVLHTTVMEVRQFLQVDRVLIYQFAPDWSGVIVAESVVEGCKSILGMQITDTYFMSTHGHTYQQGHVHATNDISTANLDACHVSLLEQMQVRAKLVVPILQENRLWGLLVAHHCRSPRHWDTWEIQLQQQLATQIAIAIQQSELYRQVQTLNTSLELQVQERTAQLQQALDFEALLKRITDRVRDSLDEGHILQAAVEELAQGLTIAACDTGIYNADQTTSTIAYEFTKTLSPAQGCTFKMETAPNAEVYPQLFRGQICHFCNIAPKPLRANQRLLTILAVPIVDDQGILGDLWLFKLPHDVFNDQEIRLVQQVANQCAIALRQSRLYQAAQAQVQELERLSQLKDDFLSTVSHELRSPMSSIKMATQMLEISLTPLGIFADQAAPINRYFRILREEGQREISLINDLLDLARLDAGTETLTFTTILLQAYIPHIAEAFAERTRNQQQQLIIDIPADLPPMTTDLPYLERVLTELLHNACKYTPAGETITVSAHATEKALEIRVSNTGVEIPPQECDRIFEKFYRIPKNDPWKHGGTGLGLALVKKLTERLNGIIRIESSAGQTTFVLEFQVSELGNQLKAG